MPHPDPDRRADLPEFDPDRPKPAWRRWLVRLISLVTLLLLVAFLAGWFFLRNDSGRQWTLNRASAAVESSSGWRVEAHDFSLSLRPGRLVLQGVKVGAPGADPLVTVDRAEAEFAWRALRRSALRQEPLVLDSVRVRGLVVDSTAPAPRRESQNQGNGEVPLTIRALEVEDAEVLGGPTEGWLETWSIRDLVMAGSIEDGGFDASLQQGILRLARRDADPLDLDLGGRARGPFEGPYTIQNVDVEGEGLEVEGSATAGLDETEPLQADFRLRADAARLLGTALSSIPASISAPRSVSVDTGDGGVLSGQGSFDFRRLTGDLELNLDGVPAELFEPLIGSEALDRAAARGTHLDGEVRATVFLGDAAFGAGVPAAQRVSGSATLTWRNDAEPLIDLQLRTLESSGDSAPVRLAVEASLLPAFQGSRRVEASLRAPSWSRLRDVRSDLATVELAVPDLANFRRLLESRWPTALDVVPILPWQGRLNLRAEIRGELRDPRVRGDARWRPGEDALVELAAEGRPMSSRARARFTTDSFQLAALRPSYQDALADLRGVLHGTLDVDLAQDESNRLSLSGQLRADDVLLRIADDAARPDLTARRLSFEGDASMPWLAGAQLATATFDGLRGDARIGVADLELPTGPAVASLEVDARLLDADLRIRHAVGELLTPLAR